MTAVTFVTFVATVTFVRVVLVVVRMRITVAMRRVLVRLVGVVMGRLPPFEHLAGRGKRGRRSDESLGILIESGSATLAAQPISLAVDITEEACSFGFALHHDIARHHRTDREFVVGRLERRVRCVVVVVRHRSSIPIGGCGMHYTPMGY
ncbi:hypothetical protein [Homoserinibacter sp. GY 40078]|uniref:hypothetical protein n=1 Tax=Homoserinibacter sp. GY 40078 TaxID=2603275 RepID=UPI00165096AD|nr:hypothetical protein [Homoserinibacter sp. GY 40078]